MNTNNTEDKIELVNQIEVSSIKKKEHKMRNVLIKNLEDKLSTI